MKILIVDDHADMRKMIKSVLMSVGRKSEDFIECESGEEAILQYGNHHPDFVLMDIHLKQMNGFMATEQIMKNDPQAKVIFISSFHSPSIVNQVNKFHTLGFVSKDNLAELEKFLVQ